MVPTGTGTSMDAPSRPVRLLPSPCRPRSAVCSGLKRKCSSVLWCWLATKTTSPPRPPSPPLGPPRGTNFSRRNARQPRPPWPASTWMSTSSTNKLLERLDADDPAARAVVFELHASGCFREDRVVLAEPRVQAGLKTASALADDDGAAGHNVPVVRLHAEPLRVGDAAVT